MARPLLTLQVNLLSGADLPADLDELEAKLQHMTPFLLDVGEIVSKQMEYNFVSQKFAPLAASTIAKKIARGYPLDILVESGALRDDATSGDWQPSGDNAVALGIPGYGAFHLDGTSAPMPARDFAFLPDSISPQIVAAFEAYIYG